MFRISRAAADHGRQRAGIGHHDLARRRVPEQHAQRDVAGFHFALDQGVVERAHQLGGTAAARRQRAQQAADQAPYSAAAAPLPLTSPNAITVCPSCMLEDIVDVARDLARRAQPDRGLQPVDLRRAVGQQDALQLARGLQVFFHAALALASSW